MHCHIDSDQQMQEFGAKLASVVLHGARIFLDGELGTGKTTLVRGLLRALGHRGAVKSPTFTLVEPYEVEEKRIYHFDLYRLSDPEELEYMGLRDYFSPENLCLVEWPDKGGAMLPAPDLYLKLSYDGSARDVTISAKTDMGSTLLNALQNSALTH